MELRRTLDLEPWLNLNRCFGKPADFKIDQTTFPGTLGGSYPWADWKHQEGRGVCGEELLEGFSSLEHPLMHTAQWAVVITWYQELLKKDSEHELLTSEGDWSSERQLCYVLHVSSDHPGVWWIPKMCPRNKCQLRIMLSLFSSFRALKWILFSWVYRPIVTLPLAMT